MARRIWIPPEDAERIACAWLKAEGFADARTFPAGSADGGVDIEAHGLVAQVKASMSRVGRPVIQQIFGIAQYRGAEAMVFSTAGYSVQARRWANSAGVGLVVFAKDTTVRLINNAARELVYDRGTPGTALSPSSTWADLAALAESLQIGASVRGVRDDGVTSSGVVYG